MYTIHTYAASAGRVKLVIGWTFTQVSSRPVDARAIQTVVRVQAFVHIGAVTPSVVQPVAAVTVAAKQSDQVLTASVHAQVAKHATLVDV